MNRQERRRLERQVKAPKVVNKKSLEYREGIREGVRLERGNWVQALSNTKGIGDKLLERVLGEVAKLYKEERL